jgi:hypothetical protein
MCIEHPHPASATPSATLSGGAGEGLYPWGMTPFLRSAAISASL